MKPAYAHSLIAARRAGRQPLEVLVLFGGDWSAVAQPKLAVKPAQCLGLDWACVAGLPVHVQDGSSKAEDDYDERGQRKLLVMLGEIARQASWVSFEVPEALYTGQPGPTRTLAHLYAYCSRDADGRWPAWWSEDTEKINARNRKRWEAECLAWLGRRAA